MEKIVFTNIETWSYKRYIRGKDQGALQRDSCDSCDSFQRRGYIASLQLLNYKYIYLNYYIYNNLPLKKGKEGVGAENCHNCHNCHTVTLSG